MRSSTCLRSFAFALALLGACAASQAQVSVGLSITVAPPALPVYEQPEVPGPNYLWAPGYWAWGADGYYWVPGTWVEAPQPGYLWTPGYWGWGGGNYLWHAGYWGPHIGFYGGVNYGFGYVGVGYAGGYWNHGAFYYNRAVTHVNTANVTNVYSKTVINNVTVNRVSYNGGNGGISARPRPEEQIAEHEPHVAPTSLQTQHEHAAGNNRALLANVNHGRPAVAATARPGVFSGQGVVAAHNAGIHNAGMHNAGMRSTALHASGGNPGHPGNSYHPPQGPPHAHNATAPHHANAPNGQQQRREGRPN